MYLFVQLLELKLDALWRHEAHELVNKKSWCKWLMCRCLTKLYRLWGQGISQHWVTFTPVWKNIQCYRNKKKNIFLELHKQFLSQMSIGWTNNLWHSEAIRFVTMIIDIFLIFLSINIFPWQCLLRLHCHILWWLPLLTIYIRCDSYGQGFNSYRQASLRYVNCASHHNIIT